MRDRSHRPVLQGVRGLLVSGIVIYHAIRLLSLAQRRQLG